MGIKKLAYIFFIILLSILHSITLTFWLSSEVDLAKIDNPQIKNKAESLLNSSESGVIAASSESNNLSE